MNTTFSKAELQAIKNKAEQNWETATNSYWKRAYEDLIFACGVLNAFEDSDFPKCPDCGSPKRDLITIKSYAPKATTPKKKKK